MRPCVLFEDGRAGRSLVFDAPEHIFVAHAPAEVAATLAGMEEARRSGLHLAGYASFELGYALEGRLADAFHRPRTPLLLFGAFAVPRRHEWPDEAPDLFVSMKPDWTFSDYARRF